MRSFRRTVVLLGALAAVGCGGDGGNGPSNSAPTADFTAPTCTVNVECSFSGTGSDADGTVTGFSWDFGDQSPAVTNQNTTHTFTSANTFQVTLTVTDNGGATGSVTKPVTVSGTQGLTASFTVSCDGLDCSFTNTSTPTSGLTFQWDFGEPASGTNNTSPDPNPTHTYSATAVTDFTVTLTVTDAQNATATTSQTITVTPAAGLQCSAGATLVDCTLDVSEKATLKITLTSRDCAFTGNHFAITAPIEQTIFTDGCSEPIGTVYPITGPNPDGSFDADTQVQAQFTQGVGKPGDPERVTPAVRLDGTFPTWTISIDDGGNSTAPGEPDFNDIVLTVQATVVP